MKSFDDATDQVAGLMAAIGGSVDAYEGEATPSAPPAAEANSFEAAYASVQSHIQNNEPKGRLIPQDIDEATYQATGKTNAELIRDMSQLSDELGGLTNPLEDEIVESDDKDYPTSEEEYAFFKKNDMIHPDHAEPDADAPGTKFDGEFWGCITELIEEGTAPKPMEDHYAMLGNVIAYDELAEVHRAFVLAQKTGEIQMVQLDSGAVEMTAQCGATDFQVYDVAKERRYVQQSYHPANGMGRYDEIEEGDLFIWVIDENSDEDDVGYIHDKWVFLREEA